MRDQDIFGYPVTLNFSQKGNTFNTYIGGAVSVFIKMVLLSFLVYKGSVLINLDGNTYFTTSKITKFDEESAINL